MTDPTVLVVPGAWHRPEHFRLLVNELSDVTVQTVTLTSSGNDPAALGDMYADAELIATATAAIDGPVVVVAHSYAGIPTTQALAGVTNVQRLVYLAAFQLDTSQSLFSVHGGSPMVWSKVHEREGAGRYLECMTPVDVFYGDVDPMTARFAVSQLGYFSYAAGAQELTSIAWESIPSTYIICDADDAIPPRLQEEFARHAQRVRRMNTSHSPFLSQPAALAQLIKQEATSA